MPRVLVIPGILRGVDGSYRQVLEGGGFEVVYPPPGVSLLDPETLKVHLAGIDATIASVEPYTRDVLKSSRLRVVARTGVGYDAIDVAAATELGVAVATTPGANDQSVAEMTIALMTGVMRGFPRRLDEVRKGAWGKGALPRLAGKTMGLVGLGRIGRSVVPRAQGLGLKVIACDPLADKAYAASAGVELCTFPELLSRADIVSLHIPAMAGTFDLINADALAQMKRGSVLINTSRGALVDEPALIDALRSGHLLGAGLDVFKTEPLPIDSPLLKLDNLLATPHMGGLDEESLEAMSRMAAQCIVDLFQGRWPDPCIVNASIRPGWKW